MGESTSERLCVILPVYNEEAVVGDVLWKWDEELGRLGIDYVIRPYNDGSKDESLRVMRDFANAHRRVEVRDKANSGHGPTILTGYRDAVRDGFYWTFQIDSDDEMGPEKFGDIWSRRGDYDFLVGRREGRVQALSRKVVSLFSRLCVRMFYGKSVWDVNSPYRLMRVSAFKEFYDAIPITTFAPNVILSGLAARHHLRCFEIQVPQHDRTTGECSMRNWKLLNAAVRSFIQTISFAFHRAHP
jgi:glycosyltransferase involved in cell wall biosynthesis